MAKFTPSKKDKAELKKLNKAISNKQSRIKRQQGFTVPEISRKKISDFTDRVEYNLWKKSVQDFKKRDNQFVQNKHGVVIPKGSIKSVNETIAKGNKMKKERLDKVKKMEFTDRGKNEGFTVGESLYQTGDRRFDRYKPTTFNPDAYRSLDEFNERKDQLEKRFKKSEMVKKDKLYRDNYFKSIDNVFGASGGELKEKIKSMGLKNFIDFSLTENLADIKFVYTFEEMLTKLRYLEGIFKV